VKTLLDRLPSWLSFRRSETAPHLVLGKRGERLAARALRKQGYKILYRNFRTPKGEVDLVCRHRPTAVLVFVEVKTRSDSDHGRPLDAVDRNKRRRLIRAAYKWLGMLNDPAIIFRFDVVEIIGDQKPVIRIVPDAFRPETSPRLPDRWQ